MPVGAQNEKSVVVSVRHTSSREPSFKGSCPLLLFVQPQVRHKVKAHIVIIVRMFSIKTGLIDIIDAKLFKNGIFVK